MVLCTTGELSPYEMGDKIKNSKILEIFNTMEYGENFEKVDNALEWIKDKEGTIFAYLKKSNEAPNGISTQIKNRLTSELLTTVCVPEIDTIKKILSIVKNKTKWIDTKPFDRTKLLNKLAAEIEQNADILAQIEILSRGILGKDTRSKAVPLLAQYFYYYSGFAVKYNQENQNWKSKGIVVGVISNENVLSNLGLVLAPALAAGYNIVLQVGTELTLAAAFILELAKKVGIPEDTIRLIPSNDGELLPYLSDENVDILALFVDLHKEKYLGINNYNKKILNFSSYKTPCIVFDTADLDSATSNIIDAAWGYNGLLPWSVNTILVQENIFQIFLDKLKTNLRRARLGLGNSKTVDISYPREEHVTKLNDLVKLAKAQGIEVFQAQENANVFSLTLFIGGQVETNKVLSADTNQDANVVTVLAFRSIDEAVNLANNTRQGLGASVWSENIGVVNELARKLKVSNVWINSHGLTTAELTMSPIKDSGVGYFGGKEGFYEYVQINSSEISANLEQPLKINSFVANAINNAKKTQGTWYKLSKINKGKLLQKFADYVDSNKKTLSATLNENWLDKWIAHIYEYITDSNKESSTIMEYGFNVTSLREPRGVVAIETKKDENTHNIRLLLSAIFEGNTVILLNDCNNARPFYKELSQMLPSGVLNLFPYTLENSNTAAVHKVLNAYFGDGVNHVYGILPVKDSMVFTVGTHADEVYRRVTTAKNVWSNIGKSSTYA